MHSNTEWFPWSTVEWAKKTIWKSLQNIHFCTLMISNHRSICQKCWLNYQETNHCLTLTFGGMTTTRFKQTFYTKPIANSVIKSTKKTLNQPMTIPISKIIGINVSLNKINWAVIITMVEVAWVQNKTSGDRRTHYCVWWFILVSNRFCTKIQRFTFNVHSFSSLKKYRYAAKYGESKIRHFFSYFTYSWVRENEREICWLIWQLLKKT